ncbi:CoA-binding protein [Desulfopila sp. IMCC35008]|uniref:CoA-binding protein n=1 Tax=Desulfopila sp. IMCC35008 TaxID=2653858 RepID=UPI0013D00538|nr:CoA-binding protein [Desulfopila sp. IMCC35008]
MLNIPEMQELRDLLSEVKTIAVVGLSPKEARPSNMVARYLIEAGYTVIPVNPGQTTILERTCYSSLDEIPIAVDLVDIFRRSEEVYPIVESAVKIGVKAVWMQQGIVNGEAADYARTQGLKVVMDRCIKIDHQSLLVEPS